MAFIDEFSLHGGLTLGQRLEGGYTRAPFSTGLSLQRSENVVAAVFVEISGNPAFGFNAGVMRRNAVPVTKTEQGAGRLFNKWFGFHIVVERNDPTAASSGGVAAVINWQGAVFDGDILLTDGVYSFMSAAASATNAMSLAFNFAPAVNKKATLIILGEQS